MLLHFLKAPFPLTKKFEKAPDGSITKEPYPNAYQVTSLDEKVKDLKGFEAALIKHAALGHCLLKGKLSRALVNESRAGSTDASDTTDWICLDIDGLPDTLNGKPTTPDMILKLLGIEDTSYIIQWSASQGIDSKTLRFHAFLRLDAPAQAAQLKQWLIHLNHTVQFLRENQTLTKTGMALKWALDITVCQNDKLIYIAPPILKGIANPLGAKPRIKLVSKKHETFTLPQIDYSGNQKLTETRIAELRAAAGLLPRKNVYKTHGQVNVLTKPDVSIISDMKQERGFVYFNLNGGDSWGYYHPENNPDYIYNFKGEPAYLTKELLPDYWNLITSQGHTSNQTGPVYLCFRDIKTSTYWCGSYDAATDDLDINPVRNETMVRHFAIENNIRLGEFIPSWTMDFDPHDSVRVDFDNKTINLFSPSKYMRATAKKVTQCPPMIFKIMSSALGNDAEVIEHFVNWLSYIVQQRDRTGTAWVLHGKPGTGKGLLVNRILRPLFGLKQTSVINMETLAQPYNGFMRQCLLVCVDEVQTKNLVNESSVLAKMKNYITEPDIQLRDMYQAPRLVRNHTSWLILSNEPDPVTIPRDDRRYNVGKYQREKLKITPKEIDKIESELQAFHDYLLSWPCDTDAVKTPLNNDDRETLMSISESSVDSIVSKLEDGSMEFFLDNLPTSDDYKSNILRMTKVEDYKKVLRTLIDRTDPTGNCNISRDELQTIFSYATDRVPESPNKFTSMLKHHRMHTKKVRIGAQVVYGIKVTWTDVGNFTSYVNQYWPIKGKPVAVSLPTSTGTSQPRKKK